MVQTGGFEPPTFGATIRRSNQLSYVCLASAAEHRRSFLDWQGPLKTNFREFHRTGPNCANTRRDKRFSVCILWILIAYQRRRSEAKSLKNLAFLHCLLEGSLSWLRHGVGQLCSCFLNVLRLTGHGFVLLAGKCGLQFDRL